VRDRGNVSCPLTDSALESERAPGIKQIGGSRLSRDIFIDVCQVPGFLEAERLFSCQAAAACRLM
jgi:hypothetical protein